MIIAQTNLLQDIKTLLAVLGGSTVSVCLYLCTSDFVCCICCVLVCFLISSSFGASGRQCFAVVTLSGYFHFFFLMVENMLVIPTKGLVLL